MKVLIYSRSFAPLIGGVETYVMLLAEGLAAIWSSAQRDKNQLTLVTEVVAGGFDDATLPFQVVRQPRLGNLIELIRGADIVQIAGPCLLPMLFAWLLRKPFVIEQHGYQAICPNGLLFFEPTKCVCPGHFRAKRYAKCWKCNHDLGTLQSARMWLLTFFRRWLCNRAAANIAVSRHVQERLQLRNSRVIYYGIQDTVQIEPVSDYRFSPPPCFAYVGRLVSEKGLDTLIAAAAVLKQEGLDFRLKFIGDGPERGHLESQVAEQHLDDRIAFTGYMTGVEFGRALAEVLVVVMPSRCEETAGLSAIEQMMRGRLVICTEIGGLGEVVGNAGLKFAAENSAELAALMRQVLETPQIITAYGKKARHRAVQCFAQDRMVQDHIEVYRSAMRQSTSRRTPAPEYQ